MLSGIDILLDRMKTHYEEFEGRGRFRILLDIYWDCLTDEEKKTLDTALVEARREKFNGEILSTLAGETKRETSLNELLELNSKLHRQRLAQAFTSSTYTLSTGDIMESTSGWENKSQADVDEMVDAIKEFKEQQRNR